MPINIHADLVQGTPEWYAARCGLLTASEMKLIITAAKLQYAKNEKEKTHVYEIASQRATKNVEPTFESFDMMRGKEEEIYARAAYGDNYELVQEVGFVTNDKWGFTLGCSPDGLVGDDGVIEAKSRKQKYQFQTIVEDEMPDDYKIQVQSILMITERKWCDFITYSNGMHMMTKRIYADRVVQDAILAAAVTFEANVQKTIEIYESRLASPTARLVPTERREFNDSELELESEAA